MEAKSVSKLGIIYQKSGQTSIAYIDKILKKKSGKILTNSQSNILSKITGKPTQKKSGHNLSKNLAKTIPKLQPEFYQNSVPNFNQTSMPNPAKNWGKTHLKSE